MREYELEVLEQYDIDVISTRKTRGAYFCDTKEGLMLLGPAGISVSEKIFPIRKSRFFQKR